MGLIIYSFNSNISPKMSHAVLEYDIVITELQVYDFAIKVFVIKRDVLCQTPYFWELTSCQHVAPMTAVKGGRLVSRTRFRGCRYVLSPGVTLSGCHVVPTENLLFFGL